MLTKNKGKHIAVAGNIGSGKTTLTKLLSEHYGWNANYEDVDENPYLNDFYNDMQRWSFNLQVYFLSNRFNQVLDIRKSGKTVIQDRTIYEDACIFAPNLHDMGFMQTRDYNNYTKLFELMSNLIQAPDLLIYLRASVSTLISQIKKRGREYESSIRTGYLEKLNERYELWIKKYTFGKLIILNVNDTDFEQADDLQQTINKIGTKLQDIC